MTTVDLITALFYEVDAQLRALPKHPEAHLWPSEVVTLGVAQGYFCDTHMQEVCTTSSGAQQCHCLIGSAFLKTWKPWVPLPTGESP